MMWGLSLSRRAAVVACVLTTGVLAACGSDEPDLIAGKQQFVQKCGACHQLARAGTKGTSGPDLDAAFQQAVRDGLGRDGMREAIRRWIEYPNQNSPMPANLVEGEAADDVAAYVARSVARDGKDTGLLATAVRPPAQGKPAVAQDGVLSVPADPTGQLAYVTTKASAEPGELTVRSPNEATVPHNIVIDGKGEGEVVTDGGISEFTASFAPGEYAFYCSVEGHREAGMEGTLVVE